MVIYDNNINDEFALVQIVAWWSLVTLLSSVKIMAKPTDICVRFVRFHSDELVRDDHSPIHDDVIKWKYFPCYWSFVRVIHRSPVNSPHKGQWHGALMFSLICAWINVWVNNREAGDLRRHRAHYDVIVMKRTKTEPEQGRCGQHRPCSGPVLVPNVMLTRLFTSSS